MWTIDFYCHIKSIPDWQLQSDQNLGVSWLLLDPRLEPRHPEQPLPRLRGGAGLHGEHLWYIQGEGKGKGKGKGKGFNRILMVWFMTKDPQRSSLLKFHRIWKFPEMGQILVWDHCQASLLTRDGNILENLKSNLLGYGTDFSFNIFKKS